MAHRQSPVAWAEEAVFYHIYPLGLLDAPLRNDHKSEPVERLLKLIDPQEGWLAHLQELGVTAVYFGPLFESTTHGYDTVDYGVVDRRLGTNDTLRRVVREFKRHHIRVVFDGVFNHVGEKFFAMQDILEKRESSQYKTWIDGLKFGPHGKIDYNCWGGFKFLPKLNLKEPAVAKHLLDKVRYWIEHFELDGLRLDAADCVDLAFLRTLREHCYALKRSFWLMGEIIHGDYNRWANAYTLHSVTNYEVYKGLWSSCNDKNMFELGHSMQRQFQTEAGKYYGLYLYNFADNHDVNRVISTLKNRVHVFPLHILLFTIPGIPSIYYGSEFGIVGKKAEGSSDVDGPLRPAFSLPAAKKGLSTTAYPSLAHLIKKLSAIREAFPALKRGDYCEVVLRNEYYALGRKLGDQVVVVVVNVDDKDATVTIPQHVFGASSRRVMDVLNNSEVFEAAGHGHGQHHGHGGITVTVQPAWGRILAPLEQVPLDGDASPTDNSLTASFHTMTVTPPEYTPPPAAAPPSQPPTRATKPQQQQQQQAQVPPPMPAPPQPQVAPAPPPPRQPHAPDVPAWARDGFFYHIYPLGFCGAPHNNDLTAAPEERLLKVIDPEKDGGTSWLDHLASLGVTALYIGPLFESSFHGYDTADYGKVDRRLGTAATLKKVVKACHAKGIKVVVDGVFNHVGRDFFAMKDIIEKKDKSAYVKWISGVKFGKAGEVEYDCWHGYKELPKLNLGEREVVDHLLGKVGEWIDEYEIDGLRLDVAFCLTKEFLTELSTVCKGKKTDFFLLSEVIHDNYNDFACQGRTDSVTNYETWKGFWSSCNDRNLFEIAHSLQRQYDQQHGLFKDLVLYNFLDNHDVNRIASHLRDPAHLYPLHLLLFTMPGIPSIYYGSEFGVQGKKGVGSPPGYDDAPLRPALTMAECVGGKPPRFHPDLVPVIQKVAKIRSESAALKQGSYHTVHIASEVFAFARVHESEMVVVAINISGFEKTIPLQLSKVAGLTSIPMGPQSKLVDVLNNGDSFGLLDAEEEVTIYPTWGRILKLTL